ncbi:MAG: hypothetical protein MZW92_05610 [Comamonadaceae bacterium]|nr:hypothetical protein [Comamonadaceae bacterium]
MQKNCDISDAHHARDMTMCTYLLEMREYFRWEHDIPARPAAAARTNSAAGSRSARRAGANSRARPSSPLPVGDAHYDPFAIEAINREAESRRPGLWRRLRPLPQTPFLPRRTAAAREARRLRGAGDRLRVCARHHRPARRLPERRHLRAPGRAAALAVGEGRTVERESGATARSRRRSTATATAPIRAAGWSA